LTRKGTERLLSDEDKITGMCSEPATALWLGDEHEIVVGIEFTRLREACLDSGTGPADEDDDAPEDGWPRVPGDILGHRQRSVPRGRMPRMAVFQGPGL
jgi:hypothetical protein